MKEKSLTRDEIALQIFICLLNRSPIIYYDDGKVSYPQKVENLCLASFESADLFLQAKLVVFK